MPVYSLIFANVVLSENLDQLLPGNARQVNTLILAMIAVCGAQLCASLNPLAVHRAGCKT